MGLTTLAAPTPRPRTRSTSALGSRGREGEQNPERTGNETTNVHRLEVTRGSGLHHDARKGKGSRAHQTPFATESIAEPEGRQCSHETTGLEDGDDVSLEIGLGNVVACQAICPVLGAPVSWMRQIATVLMAYSIKVGRLMTPPITPLSQPKDMAPKQAYTPMLVKQVVREGRAAWTHGAGQHIDAPPVDLVGIRFHGIVPHDLAEEGRHLAG